MLLRYDRSASVVDNLVRVVDWLRNAVQKKNIHSALLNAFLGVPFLFDTQGLFNGSYPF